MRKTKTTMTLQRKGKKTMKISFPISIAFTLPHPVYLISPQSKKPRALRRHTSTFPRLLKPSQRIGSLKPRLL
jgi:hypothetical protein